MNLKQCLYVDYEELLHHKSYSYRRDVLGIHSANGVTLFHLFSTYTRETHLWIIVIVIPLPNIQQFVSILSLLNSIKSDHVLTFQASECCILKGIWCNAFRDKICKKHSHLYRIHEYRDTSNQYWYQTTRNTAKTQLLCLKMMRISWHVEHNCIK